MSDYQKLGTQELADMRHKIVEEMGRIEEELNRRRAQDRHIMRSEEIEEQLKKSGHAHLVIPELGFNIHNFHAFMQERAPGAQPGRYHMHGEAVKYYLKGRGIEFIGDKQYEVKEGDIAFIPANTWHGTQNPDPGGEPLRFLAVAHSGLGVALNIWTPFKRAGSDS